MRADDHFPVLRVGSEIYSNVTVTSFTATDIYFCHARGMGNAKLKNLDPEVRKHFSFDSAKATALEKQRREASAQYLVQISLRKPESPPAQDLDENGNIVPAKLYARSFLDQRPPQIIVDQWLTPPPEVDGKFVLVVCWTSWGEPCRQAIPHLNELYAKFKDRLVIISLSDEPEEDLRKLTEPHIQYSVGTDTQRRTWDMIGLQGVPHAMLIDPQNIVRFEGLPGCLTEQGLGRLLTRYAN